MTKTISAVLFALIISCSALLFTSCKKSSSSSFTWTYRDTVNSANLHKAYVGSMALTPIIVATKGASIRRFDVSLTLSSFNAGTYNIASGSANTLLYIDFAGNTLYASSGSITITAYSTSSISGNFTASINDISGVSRSITGTFTNTPVEPWQILRQNNRSTDTSIAL